jgi:hypothetical protein
MEQRCDCLAAFALSQKGVLAVPSYRYLVLNFIGGAGLSAAGALSHQWGFVLLEGVWALVAGWGISRACVVERFSHRPADSSGWLEAARAERWAASHLAAAIRPLCHG